MFLTCGPSTQKKIYDFGLQFKSLKNFDFWLKFDLRLIIFKIILTYS
jgi:hypothetical protein